MVKYNACIQIGHFPKWLGVVVAWYLRRIMPKGQKIVLYGRGRGSANPRRNFGAIGWRKCRRVAVYVYFTDKQRDRIETLYEKRGEENWRLNKRIEALDAELIKREYVPDIATRRELAI